MKESAKITLVQFSYWGDDGDVIDRMPPFFQQAKEYGSDIIVFPEYVLGNRIPIEHERVLRSRLNDLFLDLAIDRRREGAWKRQATSETGSRFPTLLYDAAWSREETLVLVHLRDRLRAGLSGGDARVFVDRDDIVDYIASFRPPHATDEWGDEKRARNAVASVVKSGLLIPTGSPERFEISEAVEPLLPLELLQELLEALQRATPHI